MAYADLFFGGCGVGLVVTESASHEMQSLVSVSLRRCGDRSFAFGTFDASLQSQKRSRSSCCLCRNSRSPAIAADRLHDLPTLTARSFFKVFLSNSVQVSLQKDRRQVTDPDRPGYQVATARWPMSRSTLCFNFKFPASLTCPPPPPFCFSYVCATARPLSFKAANERRRPLTTTTRKRKINRQLTRCSSY